ncbi:MAG TPA: hypothetical protein VIL36_05760 [Acidimicrobiales bacterium]
MPRGLTRRLPTLLAATALVGVLAATGCADESAAVRVGDRTLSDQDLMDEVGYIYDNTALWDLIDQQNRAPAGTAQDSLRGDTEHSFSQDFVAGVLQQRVTFMLVDELFEQEGGEVTSQHRDTAEQVQNRQFGSAFAEFPESYQNQLIDEYARLVSLQETLGDEEFNEKILELIDTTDVEISSRYGTWDADAFRSAPDQLAVVPPAGPGSGG